MDDTFWRGKKVLITGHTGFKGSWLSLWLQRKGAHITGYSLSPPTKPNLFELANVAQGMDSVTGDVRDLSQLQDVTAKCQPEIVIHMAAQAIVRRSYDNPVETYTTNVMGTVNVLETVRKSDSVRVLLVITSDKCYENKEWWWGYRETDSLGGYDPYSSSKGCAELVTSAYRNSYFTNLNQSERCVSVATARAGNVIGGGDWAPNRLIPDIMNAIIDNRVVHIRYPDAVRPWQHVLEPLRGYLILVEKLWKDNRQFCGAWNFGPGEQDVRKVSWVADTLTSLWDGGAAWESDASDQRHEATYLKLDCSKAGSELEWRPRISLGKTLEWIVNWYRAYIQKSNMRKYTENEIARYEDLILN